MNMAERMRDIAMNVKVRMLSEATEWANAEYRKVLASIEGQSRQGLMFMSVSLDLARCASEQFRYDAVHILARMLEDEGFVVKITGDNYDHPLEMDLSWEPRP